MLEELGYEVIALPIQGRGISITFDVGVKSLLARDQVAKAIGGIRPKLIEFYCPATYLCLPRSLLSEYHTILSYDAPAYVNFTGTGSAILRRLEGKTLRGCDRIVSLTRYGARIATEGYGVDEENVHRIPYASSLKRPSPGEGFALSYCAESKPVVKGLPVLAETWSLLNWDMPLLVTGISRERAKESLRRSGRAIPQTMDFLGTVSPDAYEGLMSSSDFYVSAALWEEFGQSLVDALSWGKPLAVTPAFGPSEIAGTVDRSMIASSFSPEDLSRTIARSRELSRDPGFPKQVRRRFFPFEWRKVRKDLERCLGSI